MKQMIIPEKLRRGDTIGIICPSAGINPKAQHRISKARSNLKSMGFKVKLGKHVIGDATSYLSGTAEERVADLHEMFLDKDVRMILTGIGGNHSNHLLQLLDYDLIRNNPKIFIGYSDINVLHYAINTQAGLATYYGPCAATQFGEYPDVILYTKQWFENLCVAKTTSSKTPLDVKASDKWTDEFLDWFKLEDLTRARKLYRNPGNKWLSAGRAEGEALPACILSVNRLAGTPYWVDPIDKILILDILVSPGELDCAMVDSYLTDLANIGVFDVIKGLIVGRPLGYSEPDKASLYEQLADLTKKRYPVITGFDIGHTDPMVTIRYNQRLLLDSANNLIQMLD